jgi:hypothetical protein
MKAISRQERLALTLCFDKFCGTLPSPLHFTITKMLKKPHSTTDLHHSSRQKQQEYKEGHRSVQWWRVMLHVHTFWVRNHFIPLMWWPNTDSRLNKPMMLPRNKLLIHYVVMSPVHDVMVRVNVTSMYPPLENLELRCVSLLILSCSLNSNASDLPH